MNNTTATSCSNLTVGHAAITTPIGSTPLMATLVYALPIVCGLGIIGNLLSFFILKPSAGRMPSHFYLICLTVSDILALASLIPSYWAVMLVHPYYHLLNSDHVSWVETYLMIYGICQARTFLSFLFRTTSIWLIVLFTCERLISVMWPLLAQRICTVRNAAISLIFLFLFSSGVALPWVFSFLPYRRPCGTFTRCIPSKILIINRMIELVFLSIVPAVIVCTCNVLIIVRLRRQLSLMHHLVDKSSISKQQTRITRQLLVVSSVFVILTMPAFVVVGFHTVYEMRGQTNHRQGPLADLFHIAMFLFLVNLAINFLLYLLTGKNFRRACFALLCCNCRKMRRYRAALLQSSVDNSSAAGGRRNTATAMTDLSNANRSNSVQSLKYQRTNNNNNNNYNKVNDDDGGDNVSDSLLPLQPKQRNLHNRRNEEKLRESDLLSGTEDGSDVHLLQQKPIASPTLSSPTPSSLEYPHVHVTTPPIKPRFHAPIPKPRDLENVSDRSPSSSESPQLNRMKLPAVKSRLQRSHTPELETDI